MLKKERYFDFKRFKGIKYMKRGFLLMNTGSPDSPEVKDVKNYLGQFLMDPYVIDLPYPARALLVYGIILNTRPKKSAEAYKSIWTENGSPLIHYCNQLTEALKLLHNDPVELAMAYGNPSLPNAIDNLIEKDVDEICLLPLFPQYAMATVGSCIGWLKKILKQKKYTGTVRIAPPYHNHSSYIDPIAEKITDSDEHILFSYHGIPERHLKKADPTKKHCMKLKDCCNQINRDAHSVCYRQQCFETTKLIVEKANLSNDRYTISFQSRLGANKLNEWLKPYTDKTLEDMPKKGIKNLAVLCPAFFCDCLETLEEIEDEGKEIFMNAGGKSYRMIPCLNDSDEGINCLNTIMKNANNWPIQKN